MKTVIEMAREAGFGEHTTVIFAYDRDGVCTEELKRFAELIRADEREVRSMRWDEYIAKAIEVEREACWRLCDALWLDDKDAHDCREAIRARGASMRDTIDMAREAGFEFSGKELTWESVICTEELKRFAELIRADERDRAQRENAYVLAEREACAKVAEEVHPGLSSTRVAEIIRARSNT
jgi:hypothetical protein